MGRALNKETKVNARPSKTIRRNVFVNDVEVGIGTNRSVSCCRQDGGNEG
jgi:hypothetical protein